jgi:hypothetical protein
MSIKTIRMRVFFENIHFARVLMPGHISWPYLTGGGAPLSGIPVPQNFTKVNIFCHKLYF